MCRKKYSIAIVLFLFTLIGSQAQDCNFSIKGHVFDEASQLPLSFVNVFLQETSDGTMTDDKGNFLMDSICSGHYHILVSHIGCETKNVLIEISGDTTINIGLSHSPTFLIPW